MCTFSQTTLTRRTDGQTDGRTDKNSQTIAVTLRLRFAARVNNNIILLYVMHDVYCEANAQLSVLHVINNYCSGLSVVQTNAYT